MWRILSNCKSNLFCFTAFLWKCFDHQKGTRWSARGNICDFWQIRKNIWQKYQECVCGNLSIFSFANLPKSFSAILVFAFVVIYLTLAFIFKYFSTNKIGTCLAQQNKCSLRKFFEKQLLYIWAHKRRAPGELTVAICWNIVWTFYHDLPQHTEELHGGDLFGFQRNWK